MIAPVDKEYIVVVQCHLVKQRCAGYGCEEALSNRAGGFADYPKDKAYRTIYLTCGGCCGRNLNGTLNQLVRKLGKQAGIEKDRIVVHLSSCVTNVSHHGPACQHLDYLKTLIAQIGVDVRQGTMVNKISQKRRESGEYGPA